MDKRFIDLINKAQDVCSHSSNNLFFDNIHFDIDDNINGSVVIIGDTDYILIKFDNYNKNTKKRFEETLTGKPDEIYSIETVEFGSGTPMKKNEINDIETFYKKANTYLDLAKNRR